MSSIQFVSSIYVRDACTLRVSATGVPLGIRGEILIFENKQRGNNSLRVIHSIIFFAIEHSSNGNFAVN